MIGYKLETGQSNNYLIVYLQMEGQSQLYLRLFVIGWGQADVPIGDQGKGGTVTDQ